MKVTKVCCQGCGADLDVDEGIRFVTCNFCGARLEIVHDDTVTHSKLLEKIGQQTDAMADDLKVIRLQNELERLDREWQVDSQRFMVADKHGNSRPPNAIGGIFVAVVGVVFGIFWISQASRMGAPGFLPLFGLVFIGAAVFGAIRSMAKSSGMSQARNGYERRRRHLLEQIRRAGGR